jgi:transposase
MTIRDMDPEIVCLYDVEKLSVRTISRLLEVHHSVVERVLRAHGLLPALDTGEGVRPRPRMITPFEAFIDRTLERYPTIPASVLHRMVVQRGYPGAASHFRAQIAERRPKPAAEAFLRLQTLPGEQAQVDWGDCGQWPVEGGTRLLSFFVMTLSYSRRNYVRFSLDKQMGSWLEAHNAAFAYFGGVPRTSLYDNLKSAVLERVGKAKRFHPTMLDMAAWYRFEAYPVNIRKGEEKGGVEAGVKYVKSSFLPEIHALGLVGASVDDLNRRVLEWCVGTCDNRPWKRSTSFRVSDAYEKERPHLTPLPNEPFPAATETPVRVGKTPYFRFDRNDYSVPHTAVRRTLLVRADSQRVRVFDGTEQITEHPRNWGVHQLIEDPGHVARLKEVKRNGQHHARQDRLMRMVPRTEDFLMEMSTRRRRLHRAVKQLEEMLDTYGADELRIAIDEALKASTPSTASVQLILDRRQHDASQSPQLPIVLPDNPKIRDIVVKQQDLGKYDDGLIRSNAAKPSDECGRNDDSDDDSDNDSDNDGDNDGDNDNVSDNDSETCTTATDGPEDNGSEDSDPDVEENES